MHPSVVARCGRSRRLRARGSSSTARASGESNHPGATTLTVMPADARSSARPFARPTRPAFDALYAVRPSRGRSPRTEPVKISRPPSPITRAAARAPRNAPGEVHLEDLAPDRGIGLERSGHDGRDPGVADPDVDATPLGHGRRRPPPSLNSPSVTSPLSTSDGPGSSAATALRSVSVRATSATRAPAL